MTILIFSDFNVIDHPLEVWAVKVGAAPAVITVVAADGDMVLLTVLGEKRFLNLDIS